MNRTGIDRNDLNETDKSLIMFITSENKGQR